MQIFDQLHAPVAASPDEEFPVEKDERLNIIQSRCSPGREVKNPSCWKPNFDPQARSDSSFFKVEFICLCFTKRKAIMFEKKC
jgi:hypothetical protein